MTNYEFIKQKVGEGCPDKQTLVNLYGIDKNIYPKECDTIYCNECIFYSCVGKCVDEMLKWLDEERK